MPGHFDRLRERIPEIPKENVVDHALEGPQLTMKLRIVRYFADNFQELGGVSVFKRLLDSLEGLLDSIIDASGTGGAVKEFKDFVRSSTAE